MKLPSSSSAKKGAQVQQTVSVSKLRGMLNSSDNGLRLLPEDAEVTVYTDSRLCVDTITKWAPGWERKGWKRKGDPLKNLDLIKELLQLYRKHPDCKLEWIAAHDGNRWNEYADSLASAWRREEL